jgi:methionyl-tRNA formyltransferase
MSKPFSYAFFGTARFAVLVLEEFKNQNVPLPSLIITNPDRPKGRGLEMAEPPVKSWARNEGIEVVQPEKLDQTFVETMRPRGHDLYCVVAYGSLIPKSLFDLPPHKTINIHPSLLPLFRGASPIESQILADDMNVGVTLIQIDAKMDHGPIVAQEQIPLTEWPEDKKQLEKLLANTSAKLFLEVLGKIHGNTLTPVIQDDARATFTKKILKEDGKLDLTHDARENYLKYLAFGEWPRTHFTIRKNEKEFRVVISAASYANGVFTIEKVIPEGKKEMNWLEFKRNFPNA